VCEEQPSNEPYAQIAHRHKLNSHTERVEVYHGVGQLLRTVTSSGQTE